MKTVQCRSTGTPRHLPSRQGARIGRLTLIAPGGHAPKQPQEKKPGYGAHTQHEVEREVACPACHRQTDSDPLCTQCSRAEACYQTRHDAHQALARSNVEPETRRTSDRSDCE